MTTERVDIVVSEKGSALAAKNIHGVATAAHEAGTSLDFFKHIVEGVIAFETIKKVLEYADAYTVVKNQIKLTTDSTEELEAVTKRLFEISQSTRSSFLANANVYNSLIQATRNLSFSARDLIQIEETLNKVVALSGGTANGAANALSTLILRLQDGAISANEFRQVLTRLPNLAELLSKAFNKSIPEIVAQIQKGKLGIQDFLSAVQKQAGDVEQQYRKLEVTLPQAFTTLDNAAVAFFGKLDEGTGTTHIFAEAIEGFAARLPELSDAIVAATQNMSTSWKEFSEIVNAKAGTTILGDGHVRTVEEYKQAFGSLIDEGVNGLDHLTAAGETALKVLNDIFTLAPRQGKEGIVDIANTFQEAIDKGIRHQVLANRDNAVREHARTLGGDPLGRVTGDKTNPAVIDPAEIAKEEAAIKALLAKVAPVKVAQKELEDGQRRLNQQLKDGKLSAEQFADANKTLAFLLRDQLDPLAGINRELDKGIELSHLDNQERTVRQQLLEAEDNALKAGQPLKQEEIDLLENKIRFLQHANEITAIQDQLYQALAQPQETYNESLEAANNLLKEGAISGAQYADTVRDLRIALLDTQNTVEAAVERANLKLEQQLNVTTLQEQIYTDLRSPAATYAATLKALSGLAQSGAISMEELNHKLAESRIAFLDTQRDFSSGFERAILKAGEDATDFASLSENVFNDVFSRLGDVVGEFVDTAHVDLESLSKDLLKLSLSFGLKAAGGAAFSILGGLLGVGGLDITTAHTGGVVGSLSASKAVNPAVFKDAVRYHTGSMDIGGLGHNEVPIIAQQGETIRTASQEAALWGRQQVVVPVTVINNGKNTRASVQETTDASGQRSIEVLIDEITAGNLANPSSQSGRALKKTYGASTGLVRR